MNIRSLIRTVLKEATIVPPDIPNSQTFWHGGDLDTNVDTISHRKSRVEYGPGLYLTTHYGTAIKYAKGGRKLYMVTVDNGVDMNDAMLSMESVKRIVSSVVMTSKRKLVLHRLERFIKDDHVNALLLNNIIINEEAVKASNMSALRQAYVDNGIDYLIDVNTFGWGESMMVLFNMKKILQVQRIMPNDTIEKYDLH